MALKKKKTALKYTKERVVFSDVLPYEIPLIFSNRYFYNFLADNKIQIADGSLTWDANITDDAFEVLKLLFCLGNNASMPNKSSLKYNIDDKRVTIPYVYKIAHKDNSYRELSVIHPLSQIAVVDFYEKYKSLILHYCSRSNFSIRFPSKMACYYYYKDKLHNKLLGKKTDGKEEFMKEYENLKSYFSYKDFSQIYKFYESERYQTAEKKYLKQFRFDIQSCFDSIYTHSIAWAVMGNRTLYKHFITNGKLKTKNTTEFGAVFDELMQKMNHNETNGILIGPEFSRIFAEIILQYIDAKTENDLLLMGYVNGKDYECYRYVDDYFVYYNDDKIKDAISDRFMSNLREFKMTFNQSKTVVNERPFITGVSIAKEKIDEFLKNKLRIDFASSKLIDNCDDEEPVEEGDKHESSRFKMEVIEKYLEEDMRLYFNHTNFNVKYKIIINEANVKYRDIINYTLSRMLSRLERLLSRFDDRFKYLAYFSKNIDKLKSDELKRKCIEKHKKYEKLLVDFLLGLIDSVFFLYSSNKRINTTLKVVAILNVIVIYLRNNYYTKQDGRFIRFQYSSIETVYRKIQSEIMLSLETSCGGINTQLESLYLLIPLKELGVDYNLPRGVIDKCINTDDKGGMPIETNTFIILLLLYYFSNQSQYAHNISIIKKIIISKIENVHIDDRRRNSEIMILIMDLLTCPYLDAIFKNYLLTLLSVTDECTQDKILQASVSQKVWFTKWKEFDLNYELSAKVSQEVYS